MSLRASQDVPRVLSTRCSSWA